MKRKLTLLIAALALLTMGVLPWKAVGQTRTAISVDDLNWGTPQISENFNSLSVTSATATINSDSQTAYGVFNKMYNNNTGNTYGIANDTTFNSKILSLTSGSGSPLIASITKVNGDAVEFASTGAFSVRIAKSNHTMFGLYAADGNGAYAKADASVYLKFQVGSLTIANGSSWVSVGSYGYGHPDITEIRVVYNNTNSATTYGGGDIYIGAKRAHVYVNGSCVMNGDNPKEFTIPGKNLTVFRILPNNSNPATCTVDDVKIYNALPTASGPTQLATPTNFAATPGNGQLAFSWDAVAHASSYTLSYSTDSEWGSQTDVENIASNSKTVTGLTNGTTYYAKVKAIGDGVNYNPSNYSSVTSATPTGAASYAINITSPLTGGSVEANVATATAGTTITLTATPSEGYTFNNIVSNWSVIDGSSDPVTVTPGEGNTATFTMPGSDVTVSATFTLKCATPTFNPVGGVYVGTQSVEISCATDGSTIYYTTDGSEPTNESTEYTSAISVSETTTIKAIAIKTNLAASDVASATYTITQPLTTMDEIFAKARKAGSTATSVSITFGNWIISGVKNSNAYLTDGTKGCIIYASGHGFAVGDTLKGTAQCKVQLYNGSAEITNLTSSTEGLTLVHGGSVTPVVTTIASLDSINTGAVVTLNNLTYNSSGGTLSDGTNTIKPYTTLYSASWANGQVYHHVTGVYLQYNSTKEILPRSAADVVKAADMSDTDFSGLTAFTYTYSAGGPSDDQTVEIYGSDFTGNMTVTASSDYEVSLDGSTYSSSVELEQSSGDIAKDLYIRLKAGLSVGTHNGTLTFTAANLTTIVVDLAGSVSNTVSYSINLNQNTGGTISSDKLTAEAGETVTLSCDLDDCYTFGGWTVLDGSAEPVAVTNNQFTMPESDVEVDATFTQKQFTMSYSVNGTIEDDLEDDNVNCGNNAVLWDNDDLEAAGVELPSGFSLLGWSTTEGGTETVASFEPSANSTLYAVLVQTGATANYVRVTSDLSTNWAGEYLIAYSDEVFANGQIGGTSSGSIGWGGSSVDLSEYISGNAISSINGDTYKVTLEEISNGSNTYLLVTQDGKYNYQTSNSNGLASTANRSTAEAYPISVNFVSQDDIRLALGGNATGAVFRYNSGDNGYFRFYKNCGQNPVYLYKKQLPPTFAHIEEITGTTEMDSIPTNTCVVVNDGAVLTFTGANLGTAANLIIEDGAQLIHTNAVNATLQKNITAASSWKDDADGWYFIASPVSNLSTSEVTGGSSSSNYDLFAYDEITAYWHSNTGTLAPFDTLERGKGYLYANKYSVSLDIAGLMIGTETEVTKPLSFTPGQISDVRGFNLMGNPFTRDLVAGDIIKTTGDNTKGDTVITAYYGINDATTGMVVRLISETPIKPGQGFFVQSKTANQKLVFNPSKKDEPVDKGYISIAAGNDDYMDKAYVQIKNGNTLRKMNIANSTSVSVMYHGDDYAAARVDELAEIMPVNFKAVEDGTYTITVEAKQLEARRMILIDNFTYKEIDLLLEPSYTFHASADDPETRFLLAFNFNNYDGVDENNTESVFAYQNGNDIIVNGEGTLQVFDMLGRLVTSFTVNGNERISTSQFNTGVYIFRMVGSEVKTQKIVVR